MGSVTENKSEKPLPKMLPGAVCAQMVKCGKPNCKCTRGELHGPYFYRFYRCGNKLRKVYVRKSEAAALKAACDSYRSEQQQIRQIILETNQRWRELTTLLKELAL